MMLGRTIFVPFSIIIPADIAAQHIACSGGQPQIHGHLAADEKYYERCDICSQIDNFRLPVGFSNIHPREDIESYDQKCSRTRAVKSVIHADDQRRRDGNRVQTPPAHRLFGRSVAKQILIENEKSTDRQNDHHERHHYLLTDEQGEPGSAPQNRLLRPQSKAPPDENPQNDFGSDERQPLPCRR